MLVILFFSVVISLIFKTGSNFINRYQQELMSEQVCNLSQARLQVGSTREVVDVAKAALLAAGYPDAEIKLQVGNLFFTNSDLNAKSANIFFCATTGREDVQVQFLFPNLSFLDFELFLAFLFSFTALFAIKILVSILLRGLQNKFILETDRRLGEILGFENVQKNQSPKWIDWLYKTSPKSFVEFKNKLMTLEENVAKQAKTLALQAQEKVIHDFQIMQAKKFKDLAHQVRHDLRQTLGVIKSSVKTLPKGQAEKNILSGAVTSLEVMIDDLKDREFENNDANEKSIEVLEVVLYEVISEQRAFLGTDSGIKILLDLSTQELSAVAIQSSELKRVFTNLVRNSIEALAGDGVIKIFVTKLVANKASITIEDSGFGFTADALNNLFKKGFTTKSNG